MHPKRLRTFSLGSFILHQIYRPKADKYSILFFHPVHTCSLRNLPFDIEPLRMKEIKYDELKLAEIENMDEGKKGEM